MKYQVVCEGTEYEIEVIGSADDGGFELRIEGERIPVVLDGVAEPISRIALGDRQFEFGYVREAEEGRYHVVLDGIDYSVELDDARMARYRSTLDREEVLSGELLVRAPIPSLVVGVEISVGDRVEVGQRLLVLDAMKLENEILATETGEVTEIAVGEGDVVERDQLLLKIER